MNQSDETKPPMRPAAPCAMISPEADLRLKSMEDTLHEIKGALVGNPKLGHKGLCQRLETIETRVEAHDRKLLVWGSVITAFLTAFEFLKDRLFRAPL